jgi:hypothetical protein
MNRRILITLIVVACLGPWIGSSAHSQRDVSNPTVAVPDGRRVDGPGRAGAAAVSEDSLRAMVRFLSTNRAGDSTRFVLRESSIAVIADSLAARLGRYTGTTVGRFPFKIDTAYATPESVYTAVNLVARLPGTGSLPGALLVTAHYDCISMHTPGWKSSWQTKPSPGADDNATGVAAVMEAARVLRSANLPFAVTFVLFSGEELGLLGSEYLADSVVVTGTFLGDRIVGVLNSDMLGYRPPGTARSGCLLSTYNASWLSDMIIRSAAEDPGLSLRLLDPGPSDSDHASFWALNIPAVTFTEPLEQTGVIANPFYHSLGDTLGTIDFGQTGLLTEALVGFVEKLAQTPPEIAMSPSDLFLITSNGRMTGRRSFFVGDTLSVRARVRNVGVQNGPQGAAAALRITLQNGTGAQTLYTGSFAAPAALSAREAEVRLVLTGAFAGENMVKASIVVSGMENDPANDSAELDFAVEGGNPLVLMHAFEPNPITGSFPSGHFCVNLVTPLPLAIELYNIEGQRIATGGPGRWGTLHAGLNCVPCSMLFPGLSRLASGVYVYRLISSPPGAPRVAARGRFAVQN